MSIWVYEYMSIWVYGVESVRWYVWTSERVWVSEWVSEWVRSTESGKVSYHTNVDVRHSSSITCRVREIVLCVYVSTYIYIYIYMCVCVSISESAIVSERGRKYMRV